MSQHPSRRLRRLAALAAGATALTCAGVAYGAPTFTATDAIAPTSNGVGRMLSLQMYKARFTDAATADRIAKENVAISLQASQLNGWGDEMHAANPSLRLYLYTNGMFAQADQGTTFPESWYLKAADGTKIQSAGYGNYLMDPRSTQTYVAGSTTYAGWADYVARSCKTGIARSGNQFDGCFVDMLGTSPLSASYNVGGKVPVDAATGQPFTTTQWYTQLTQPVASKIEEVTGRPVVANGIGNGKRYYGTAQGPSRLLLDEAAGGDAEIWLRNPGADLTAFPADAAWRTEVQMLADSSAQNGWVNATVKTWVDGTVDQKEQWRRYALGSFLIGNGGHATFEFTSDDTASPFLEDSPLYDLPIGSPTETFASVGSYLRGGVYQRAFTNGKVLVNTSAAAVTVSLGAAYKTPDGTAVTQVTVPARDAAILTK
jgi:hypothetical protein